MDSKDIVSDEKKASAKLLNFEMGISNLSSEEKELDKRIKSTYDEWTNEEDFRMEEELKTINRKVTQRNESQSSNNEQSYFPKIFENLNKNSISRDKKSLDVSLPTQEETVKIDNDNKENEKDKIIEKRDAVEVEEILRRKIEIRNRVELDAKVERERKDAEKNALSKSMKDFEQAIGDNLEKVKKESLLTREKVTSKEGGDAFLQNASKFSKWEKLPTFDESKFEKIKLFMPSESEKELNESVSTDTATNSISTIFSAAGVNKGEFELSVKDSPLTILTGKAITEYFKKTYDNVIANEPIVNPFDSSFKVEHLKKDMGSYEPPTPNPSLASAFSIHLKEKDPFKLENGINSPNKGSKTLISDEELSNKNKIKDAKMKEEEELEESPFQSYELKNVEACLEISKWSRGSLSIGPCMSIQINPSNEEEEFVKETPDPFAIKNVNATTEICKNLNEKVQHILKFNEENVTGQKQEKGDCKFQDKNEEKSIGRDEHYSADDIDLKSIIENPETEVIESQKNTGAGEGPLVFESSNTPSVTIGNEGERVKKMRKKKRVSFAEFQNKAKKNEKFVQYIPFNTLTGNHNAYQNNFNNSFNTFNHTFARPQKINYILKNKIEAGIPKGPFGQLMMQQQQQMMQQQQEQQQNWYPNETGDQSLKFGPVSYHEAKMQHYYNEYPFEINQLVEKYNNLSSKVKGIKKRKSKREAK